MTGLPHSRPVKHLISQGKRVPRSYYFSCEELSPHTYLWKTIDKDSDGQLDIAEFSAFEGEGRLIPPQDPDMGELGAAPYPDTSK